MDDRNQNVRVITVESDSKFVLDTCCGCVPLRTGCLILGYMQLFGCILYGIFSVLGVESGSVLLVLHNVEDTKDQAHREKLKTVGTAMIILGALLLVMILITLPFTIRLLVGLYKERRSYVKQYLIFQVVCLVLTVIIYIVKFASGYGKGKEALSAVINVLLSIYFLLVLRSHYIKMGQANNLPAQHYRDGQMMQKA